MEEGIPGDTGEGKPMCIYEAVGQPQGHPAIGSSDVNQALGSLSWNSRRLQLNGARSSISFKKGVARDPPPLPSAQAVVRQDVRPGEIEEMN